MFIRLMVRAIIKPKGLRRLKKKNVDFLQSFLNSCGLKEQPRKHKCVIKWKLLHQSYSEANFTSPWTERVATNILPPTSFNTICNCPHEKAKLLWSDKTEMKLFDHTDKKNKTKPQQPLNALRQGTFYELSIMVVLSSCFIAKRGWIITKWLNFNSNQQLDGWNLNTFRLLFKDDNPRNTYLIGFGEDNAGWTQASWMSPSKTSN